MLEHSNMGFNGIQNEGNQRAAFCSAFLERPFCGGLGPGRGRGEGRPFEGCYNWLGPPQPQYPGGSTERRVCLEGTRKDSTASGASPWTAAAHGAGTHRTYYSTTGRSSSADVRSSILRARLMIRSCRLTLRSGVKETTEPRAHFNRHNRTHWRHQ
jgi:hypothetical protein